MRGCLGVALARLLTGCGVRGGENVACGAVTLGGCGGGMIPEENLGPLKLLLVVSGGPKRPEITYMY